MQRSWDARPERALPDASSVERVALLSVHTCPLDQPGTGDSGGMNVYVRQVARRLAEMGVAVDVFSRWSGASQRIRTMDPGVRVIHLAAGPDRPIPKDELHQHLCAFLYSLLQFEAEEAARIGAPSPIYDVVHSHYWLSGWVGRLAAERWNVPLLQSFHTLGRVKNLALVAGEPAEPAARIAAEERIVQTADRVLAPTPQEATDLVRLYQADPERVCVISPGVDTDVFRPSGIGRIAARRLIGLSARTVILFAGRLQVLKSPDIAVRAVAELARRHPELDPVLVVLGGPSGNASLEPAALEKLAVEVGLADRLIVREPVPHVQLPVYYGAADVVLVPSRTESFGLVALEAAACGTPVVATDVGGLRTTVRDGVTGILVPGADPRAYADAIVSILCDSVRAAEMSVAAARFARRYDWRQAATGLLSLYEQHAADHARRSASS